MEEDSLTWLMKEFLKKPADPKTKKTNKQIYIEKVFHKAVKEGDPASIKLIWNYLDGMPKQSLGLEGSEENPVVIKIVEDIQQKREE
jgi:hypothetical protein